MAGIIQIKNEIDLMNGLEKIMGLNDSIELSGKDIAHKIGLGHWSKSLQKKFDLLKNSNRIKVEKAPRKRMLITLIKPLTTTEKKELTQSIIFDEPIEQQIDKVEEQTTDKVIENTEVIEDMVSEDITLGNSTIIDITQPESINSYTNDIDEIFDDIQNKTRGIVSRYKTLEEKNRKLELELEISKKREQKWMQRAIQYQSQL